MLANAGPGVPARWVAPTKNGLAPADRAQVTKTKASTAKKQEALDVLEGEPLLGASNKLRSTDSALTDSCMSGEMRGMPPAGRELGGTH